MNKNYPIWIIKRIVKKETESKTFEKILKGLTSMSFGPKGRKRLVWKTYLKNCWNFPKFSETCKFTASRNSILKRRDWKTKNPPPTSSLIIIKLLRTKDLKKHIFKASESNDILHLDDNYSKDCRFCIRNHGTRTQWNIFKVWKKRTVNPAFHVHRKYPSRIKAEWRCSQKYGPADLL